MPIRTIFDTVRDCTRNERQGWVEFIGNYEPMARTVLTLYFPALLHDLDTAVAAVFLRAHGEENAWFQALQFTNEREFAFAFRELLVDHGNTTARLPLPALSAGLIDKMMEGLATIQRELFWVFLRGYSVEQASAILMNASATAAQTHDVMNEHLTKAFPGVERALVLQAAMNTARSTATADCLCLKTFNNLINGQIAWHDRERAEEHIARCLNCLDRFTAFQESIWLRRTMGAAAEQVVQQVLSHLKIYGVKKSMFGKLFSPIG